MDEYVDLDTYNGNAVHDIWVDFDSSENTGTPYVFDGSDLDEYIYKLNDWD